MFIKVKHTARESLYECDRYHINPTENDDVFIITMEKDSPGNGAISLEIHKTQLDTAIYIMNQEGKTIDTVFSNRS